MARSIGLTWGIGAKYTFSIYTGSETRAAIRHFDEVLLDLYDDAIAPKETDGKCRRSK